MCHEHSAGRKTFTECHTKSHGVAFDTQVLWLLANGREACALLCNHRSLLHVFSLVQTTIGFGNPCRIGSLAYHMRSVCVSGTQAVDKWLCLCGGRLFTTSGPEQGCGKKLAQALSLKPSF